MLKSELRKKAEVIAAAIPPIENIPTDRLEFHLLNACRFNDRAFVTAQDPKSPDVHVVEANEIGGMTGLLMSVCLKEIERRKKVGGG